MTKKEKKFLHLALALCFLSGASMFVLDQFFYTQDEFGFVPHPFLNSAKMAHYLAAPFLIFAFGLLWRSHIAKGLFNPHRPKKVSGWSLLILMTILVFSGQALLFLVQTGAQNAVGWVHTLAGTLMTMTFFAHALR